MTINERKSTNSSETLRTVAMLLVIVFGMLCTVSLARWIDARRPQNDPGLEEEQLYVTANVAKRMSLGFNGLVADWYWMRSLQYVGRKVLSTSPDVPLDDLGALNLKLLAHL